MSPSDEFSRDPPITPIMRGQNPCEAVLVSPIGLSAPLAERRGSSTAWQENPRIQGTRRVSVRASVRFCQKDACIITVDLSDIQSPFGDYLTSVAEARAHPDKDVKKILTNGANPDPGDISAEGQINIDALAEFRRADDEVILLVRFSNISLANTSPMATRAHLGLPKWRLKRVQTYIETHMEEQITTAALAGAVGLSPTYFAGQFKTSTGLCPHDYVTRKRIETAQRLLLDPNLKIIEIAIGVGFQTQAHFTTSFKKIVGMTPWKWRRDNYAGV